MKTLLLSAFLTLTSFLYCQDSFGNADLYTGSSIPQINLHLEMNVSQSKSYGYNESHMPLGLGMMLGGAVFTTAGLLTVPDYEVGPNGETVTKPFFRQGARMMAIMTGAGVFTAGCIISIGR